MLNYNDSSDTDIQSSKDIDWETPILTDEEKTVIKRWASTGREYKVLREQSERFGRHITRSDEAILRDTASVNQSILPYIQKLRSVLYFAYYNSPKLAKDALIFDMWAAHVLQYDYQFNILTKEFETQGRVVDPEDLYHDSWMTYRRALGLEANNKEQFISLLRNYLRDSKVNPWLKLMDKVYPVTPEEFITKHGFDPHRMCEFVTGDSRELQQFLWLVQFIGGMARTYTPGCQHDHMLVLMSPVKGMRKTSFLRALATDPSTKDSKKYYVQMRTLKSEKKDQERLRGKIIVNIDECDSAFYGTNSDDLKEAITSRDDNYRAPYDRSAKDYPRTCVLFGTSNTPGLLQDYTGDRRIFIVHVQKVIDVEWLTENWYDFWGFYKWAYNQMKDGNIAHYRNYLNKNEEDLVVANQSEYKAREPWLDALDGVMDVLEQTYPSLAVKASDILAVIGNEIESKKRYVADHIKDILKTERSYKEGRPRLLGGKQPSKPILYLMGAEEDKPELVSREAILKAYQSYLRGIYPEDKPAAIRNTDASKSTLAKPEVIISTPCLLPPTPEVIPEGLEDNMDDFF
ncbi:virulence-associated E family protein [Nostoc sp. NIES-4103]|nr:virulence-associated E family protein [Nostoc sp. NIES-4103]